jgi:hypothetical protein
VDSRVDELTPSLPALSVFPTAHTKLPPSARAPSRFLQHNVQTDPLPGVSSRAAGEGQEPPQAVGGSLDNIYQPVNGQLQSSQGIQWV